MHNKLLMDMIENVYLYTIKTLGECALSVYSVVLCSPLWYWSGAGVGEIDEGSDRHGMRVWGRTLSSSHKSVVTCYPRGSLLSDMAGCSCWTLVADYVHSWRVSTAFNRSLLEDYCNQQLLCFSHMKALMKGYNPSVAMLLTSVLYSTQRLYSINLVFPSLCSGKHRHISVTPACWFCSRFLFIFRVVCRRLRFSQVLMWWPLPVHFSVFLIKCFSWFLSTNLSWFSLFFHLSSESL